MHRRDLNVLYGNYLVRFGVAIVDKPEIGVRWVGRDLRVLGHKAVSPSPMIRQLVLTGPEPTAMNRNLDSLIVTISL